MRNRALWLGILVLYGSSGFANGSRVDLPVFCQHALYSLGTKQPFLENTLPEDRKMADWVVGEKLQAFQRQIKLERSLQEESQRELTRSFQSPWWFPARQTRRPIQERVDHYNESLRNLEKELARWKQAQLFLESLDILNHLVDVAGATDEQRLAVNWVSSLGLHLILKHGSNWNELNTLNKVAEKVRQMQLGLTAGNNPLYWEMVSHALKAARKEMAHLLLDHGLLCDYGALLNLAALHQKPLREVARLAMRLHLHGREALGRNLEAHSLPLFVQLALIHGEAAVTSFVMSSSYDSILGAYLTELALETGKTAEELQALLVVIYKEFVPSVSWRAAALLTDLAVRRGLNPIPVGSRMKEALSSAIFPPELRSDDVALAFAVSLREQYSLTPQQLVDRLARTNSEVGEPRHRAALRFLAYTLRKGLDHDQALSAWRRLGTPSVGVERARALLDYAYDDTQDKANYQHWHSLAEGVRTPEDALFMVP